MLPPSSLSVRAELRAFFINLTCVSKVRIQVFLKLVGVNKFLARVIRRVDINTFYLSGITLAVLPNEVRLKLAAKLNELRQAGKICIFDTNYRPALWSGRWRQWMIPWRD